MPRAVIDDDSELGQRYIAAMELASRYGYAGREKAHEPVRQMIGGVTYRRLSEVLAHHAGSIRVPHTLRSFAVAMAGGRIPPWKD